jgi:hypothetical protein
MLFSGNTGAIAKPFRMAVVSWIFRKQWGFFDRELDE